MKDIWQFLLLGLSLCPAYVLAAQALVLISRGSRVINFATSSLSVAGAFVYYEILKAGLPSIVALIVGVAAAAIIGAAMHTLIMRPLAKAAQLTRVIATLGLSLIATSVLAL